MKRLLTSLCLTGCLCITNSSWQLFNLPSTRPAQAAAIDSDLFYTFYGKKIPLVLRQDTIAVAFKSGSTRSLGFVK